VSFVDDEIAADDRDAISAYLSKQAA